MARITFVVEASDSNKRDLASLLEDEKILELKGKTLMAESGDVDEGLARWLLGSLIAHHGLRPDVTSHVPLPDSPQRAPRLIRAGRGSRTSQMPISDDQMAVGSAIVAQTDYNSVNRAHGSQSVVGIVVGATVITTSLQVQVFSSLDGAAFRLLYSSPAMTGVPRFRRIIFSQSGAASDTDTAAVDAVINKPPILEGQIRVRLIPTGSCTVSVDILYGDP